MKIDKLMIKEIKKELKNLTEALPNKEIKFGLKVDKIGSKYLTVINTVGSTSVDKIPLIYFKGLLSGQSLKQCVRNYMIINNGLKHK